MVQARRYTLVLCLFLGGTLSTTPTLLQAQLCPDSPTCNAVFGSLVLPSSSTPTVPNRVVHMEESSPDGLFTDNIIGLTYNRSWSSAGGVLRDNVRQPLTWLGLESWYGGGAELNIDLVPPNSSRYLRPFGFEAHYDGTYTILQIGGEPYASGAAAVRLQGGTSVLNSVVTIQDNGRSSATNMLEMQRKSGTDSFAWRAGDVPRLDFALNPAYNATGFGNYGVLKFGGEWDYGEPIMEFEQVGIGAKLLNSYPVNADTNPRFTLLADGRINWGSGAAPADTDLYRSATSTLRTDGSLVIGGNLMVTGSKAALVQTASYGKREVYAVESPGEWFEDFGTGKLVHGRAVVQIDPMFGEVVTTGYDYHVFLTANGPCSLYVAHKQPNAFMVRSLRGSISCGFDYRIVAKRKGHENVRLAEIRDEK